MNMQHQSQVPQYMIKRGDVIQVKAQGVTRTGPARTVDFDRATGTWMIEMDSREAGYCYWKQHSDGGTVELLEVGPELPTLPGILRALRDHTNSIDEMEAASVRDMPECQWIPKRGYRDQMGAVMSWDVTAGNFPITTVYLQTLWNDDQSQESELVLVGEEAMEMVAWIYEKEMPVEAAAK